jgi:hypothetical protein
MSGVDFGFNFSTIVSTRDAGQGTLRQFLVNANALQNAALAQAGLAAGVETSVFMIPDGAAHPGLRAGLVNALTGGVARIALQSALPAITGAATRVDGGTQTANVGQHEPGHAGRRAHRGRGCARITALSGPELELRGAPGIAIGFDVQASMSPCSHWRCRHRHAAGSDASALVRVGSPRTPNAARPARARHHRGRVRRPRCGTARERRPRARIGCGQRYDPDCLMGFGAGSAVALTSASQNWQVDGCALVSNTSGNGTLGQVLLAASGALTMTRTLVQGGDGPGFDALTATGSVALTNVTLRNNGRAGNGVTAGARLGGPGGTIARCVLNANFGAGAQVVAGSNGWTITRNAFSSNGSISSSGGGGASGQIGIDLQAPGDLPASGSAPYVTRNDVGDADAGGNSLVNFPVLESAILGNGQFSLSGWARPGASIELYVSDGDPSGFGEGLTWLGTFTEGSPPISMRARRRTRRR